MSVLKSVMQNTQTKHSPDFSTLSGRESIFLNLINQNPGIHHSILVQTDKECNTKMKEHTLRSKNTARC